MRTSAEFWKLDFCSNNFHIFRFSQSGKREVDVSPNIVQITMCFVVTIPRHNSPLMHMTLMHTTDQRIPRDLTLLSETKVDVSLGTRKHMNHCVKICHYQQNVPQHYYLLDTLVLKCHN